MLTGTVPGGTSQAWLGVVVDDKLYQVCFTMNKLLTNTGYTLIDRQNYPTIYRMSSVSDIDKKVMERHIENSIRRK